MNPQREFINETFHVLAQPITALRATIELGLSKATDVQSSKEVLADCLGVIERLMQDLAVFREIASLDEMPSLTSCDGHMLLGDCMEEMAPVAEDRGIALRLTAEPVAMQCNQLMFQRALFLLLDDVIASTPRGGEITLSLHIGKDGVLLEGRPGTLKGPRKKLFLKLMQFAGGSSIGFVTDCVSVTFLESRCHFPSQEFLHRTTL